MGLTGDKIATLTVGPHSQATRLSEEGRPSRIVFPSVNLLLKTCTIKRLEILRAMTGSDVLPVREVARRVGRDVKAVHRDMSALASAGLLDRDASGHMRFPYQGLRMDVDLLSEL